MKKVLIVLAIIIFGLYKLGDWASDPETLKEQSRKLGEASQQLKGKMIDAVKSMSDAELNKAVEQNKAMMKQMIAAVSNNTDMKNVFEKRLDDLNHVNTKEDYIRYLQQH